MSIDGHINSRVEVEPGVMAASTLPWWHGWAPVVVLPCAVLALFPPSWPRCGFMWALAFAIYAGCKWLTWRRTPVAGAGLARHLGYLLTWPGLDAAAFLKSDAPTAGNRPTGREWLFALFKLMLGGLILFLLAGWLPPASPYLVGWVGMTGIVMMLHFGLFHLLSCGWRNVGAQARPLMNWPLASTSVSEFWGRRWNAAFRDLTHRFVFRPLVPRCGTAGAVVIGFFFSGLVHELVISLPARGGYGGPTLFFTVQGMAILLSRSGLGRRLHLARGLSGWAFTTLVLLGPACLLFHPPFVSEIVVPFMRVLRAV